MKGISRRERALAMMGKTSEACVSSYLHLNAYAKAANGREVDAPCPGAGISQSAKGDISR